ncbi:MAG: protein-export chaperone SecB [Alphaproteobacteria bacterium]|nr:protein-export chaperone SecB [Alphaproteobacteria bacterium]
MTEANTPPSPPQIGISAQYIKDFSFENPNAPQIFAPSQKAPELNMGVNIKTRTLADNTYEVLLMMKLESKLDGNVAFIGELSYGGVFTVPFMPEDALKFILMAEAPRHLFPFARAILSDAIRDAGFPQIIISPIDFVALYQANAGNLDAVAGTA